MFAIIVTEKGGEQRRLDFDKSEVTIGRVQGNDVILPKGNVSKRHARIVLKDGKFIIVDLKSTNGTYVNGRKITSPLVVKDNDKIYIGDFILGVEDGAGLVPGGPVAGQMQPPGPTVPPPVPGPPPQMSAPPHAAPMPGPPQPMAAPPHAPPAPVGRPAAPPLGGMNDAPAVMPPPAQVAAPAVAPHPPQPAPPARRPARTSQQPPQAQARRPRLVGAGAPRPAVSRPAVQPRRAAAAPLDPKSVKALELVRSILDRVLPKLEIDGLPIEKLGDEELWQRTEGAIIDMVESMDAAAEIPNFIDQDALIKDALNEALGLGPLEDLLADERVEEILVDRRDRITVSKGGALFASGKAFSSDETFRRVVERLVAPTGQVIDGTRPLVDVRLRDGSRLAAALPPVAVRGACLTLQKPRSAGYNLADLVSGGTLSAAMGDFLTTCVAARKNLLVCGAPGAGKSSVLSALAGAAPDGERIVSVEEVSELSIVREEWVALESRPSDGNGVPAVDLATVLRSALRMRPDRLVVGDVRGAEALELVSAMASSNDGTLASIAGDGARAALARLSSMARLAAPGSSAEAIRELVATAVDVVVHVARYADGVYRVASIEEVLGAADGGFATQELFSFRGADSGGFAAAGVIPAFYAELESRGMPADTTIFRG